MIRPIRLTIEFSELTGEKQKRFDIAIEKVAKMTARKIKPGKSPVGWKRSHIRKKSQKVLSLYAKPKLYTTEDAGRKSRDKASEMATAFNESTTDVQSGVLPSRETLLNLIKMIRTHGKEEGMNDSDIERSKHYLQDAALAVGSEMEWHEFYIPYWTALQLVKRSDNGRNFAQLPSMDELLGE